MVDILDMALDQQKEEKDIIKLIEAEQGRRRRADAEHVRRLSRGLAGDAEAFCAHRRLLLRVAAMVLILTVLLGGRRRLQA